jgi:hypothetical protein
VRLLVTDYLGGGIVIELGVRDVGSLRILPCSTLYNSSHHLPVGICSARGQGVACKAAGEQGVQSGAWCGGLLGFGCQTTPTLPPGDYNC